MKIVRRWMEMKRKISEAVREEKEKKEKIRNEKYEMKKEINYGNKS